MNYIRSSDFESESIVGIFLFTRIREEAEDGISSWIMLSPSFVSAKVRQRVLPFAPSSADGVLIYEIV